MLVFTKWCKRHRQTWPLIVKNSYDQSWIPRRLTHSMMDNGWWWWMMVLWWWWVVGEVWERWCAKGWVEMAPNTPIYRLNRSSGTASCPLGTAPSPSSSLSSLIVIRNYNKCACRKLTTPPCPLGTAPWWATEASMSLSFLLALGHGPVLTGHGACSVFCLLYFAWEDAIGRSGMPLLFLFLYLC